MSKFEVELKIKNIGPHKDLCFSQDLDSNKVIIYGANGEGKSFISRAFRLATPNHNIDNADDLIHLDQSTGHFNFKIISQTAKELSITLNKNKIPIINNNTGLIFHVFNSDYVDENLRINNYNPNGDIDGYILGKEHIDLFDDKIELDRIKSKIQELEKEIDEHINNAKVELRKQGVQQNTKEFNSITKENLYNEVYYENVESYDNILKKLDALNRIPDSLSDINKPRFSSNIDQSLIDNIKNILLTSYKKQRFKDEFASYIRNNQLFIEKGLDIFKKERQKCPFCQQDLGQFALEIIQKYEDFILSKEAKVIKDIDNYIDKVKNCLEDIKNFIMDTINANKMLNHIKDYFPSLNNINLTIPESNDEYINSFNKLIEMLNLKKQNIENTHFELEKIITKCNNYIISLSSIRDMNSSYIEHANITKSRVNEERLSLRKNLCKAQFNKLLNNLGDKIKEKKFLSSEEDMLSEKIKEKQQCMRINKKDKVYDTLTYFLNKFFDGKYSIDKNTFEIQFYGYNVGQKASKILSDGEKSIVAFCYFLASTHLLMENVDDYNNLFFVIDDPISSMDFHYVYSVAQSLRDIKKHFNIENHERIWIFTHNLEFFSILLRNNIMTHSYILRKGEIEKINRKYVLPYESHLTDIYNVSTGKEIPKHTIGNSIRHVIETICRFEYPYDKNLETYVSENPILANNSCIYSFCQDLSHGALRMQEPYTDDVIIEACKTVIDFVKSKYQGQIEAIELR